MLTQSHLFKAKHHLLHIQLMVAMENNSSHCTALLQYAWQLKVYHSEYFYNDISWSTQHQTINLVKNRVFNIYIHKCKYSHNTQKYFPLYSNIMFCLIKYFFSNLIGMRDRFLICLYEMAMISTLLQFLNNN